MARAYRTSRASADALVRGFAEPLGYRLAASETVVELDLTAHTDGGELGAAPPAPRDGYRVETHVDGVPRTLRDETGELRGLVDAEAPRGDLDRRPAPVSPDQYAAELELWRSQVRTMVETVARDEAGAVVAWTGVLSAPDPARAAHVEGTYVRAEHRGRGLGAAVEVASMRIAREHGVRRVRTSSDGADTAAAHRRSSLTCVW